MIAVAHHRQAGADPRPGDKSPGIDVAVPLQDHIHTRLRQQRGPEPAGGDDAGVHDMRGTGVERLVKARRQPLVIGLGLGCLPAQEVRLRCPGVRAVQVQDHELHVAVIEGIDRRTRIAAGGGRRDVAAEAAVVVVSLGGSQKMAAQEGLSRPVMDTAASEQQLPLPLTAGRICQVACDVGKSQIVPAVQQREHGACGPGVGHGTDLRIRQEGKGKRTVVRRCLKCARTGAGDLIGIRTAREKACQLCGVKVFPSRIRPDRCGGIDSCPRRPGDGDRPMDRVRRGIRQISSVRRLADVQRHLPHAAGRQTREDAEQAQGRSQERGDAPGSDVRLHLPSLSLFRCAHLSGPK